MGMTYLIYPGGVHKRFEHSLGVIGFASWIFDVISNKENLKDVQRNLDDNLLYEDKKIYWRRVLRMAALCHDVGHFPFSHSAESILEGNHEKLSRLVIEEKLKNEWMSITPHLRVEDIIKIAFGPKKIKDKEFNDFEILLSEIITGEVFGADRIDYLIRDSYHTGVGYGMFDYHRLIDTMRLFSEKIENNSSFGIKLGVEEGGFHSAESLLLARYFMFTQLYYHPVRMAYDILLEDFTRTWLISNNKLKDLDYYLEIDDNDINHFIKDIYKDRDHPSYEYSMRIIERKHFRVLYQRYPSDIEKNPNSVKIIYENAKNEFGDEFVKYATPKGKKSDNPISLDFPVRTRENRIENALYLSEITIPEPWVEYVLVAPEIKDNAKKWLDSTKDSIIRNEGGESDGE
jgi:hypothetical protein